jgi:hypothetical protein
MMVIMGGIREALPCLPDATALQNFQPFQVRNGTGTVGGGGGSCVCAPLPHTEISGKT